MNIIILGPQGSGKGTQANLLAEKLGYLHIEMGRILRSVANSDNQYAQIVKETIENGKLVPDEYVRLIAWDHINKYHNKVKGFIFEGYPRSLAQFEHVEDMFKKFGEKIDKIILIEISEQESINRLSNRRTCEKCGEIWNLKTKPPKNNDVCDNCGGKLILRADDKPEAIKTRLEIYRQQTTEIVETARQREVLMEINGEQEIDKIFDEIMSGL